MDKKLEKLMADEGVSEQAVYTNIAARPWRQQQEEVEARKEDTRSRIRNASIPEGTIIRRPKPQPTINDLDYKKVAVYARVSTQSEEQVSSIENQTRYYTEKIQEKPNWELYRIYADEGKSGTSMKHRVEFRQMLEDASQQKFDTILCASVSRFARNVTDCIEQIKHLKTDNPRHPVGVYFETEGLYTLDPNSTMALFIHAMLADWESDNKSKRMILSYDQRISTGQYQVADLLGFRHTREGGLVIQKDEAITVRYIFLAYLAGNSLGKIAETLTKYQRPTLTGRTNWNADMVHDIMMNERRWGDLEARKSIVIDYKEKKTVKNCDMRISAYVPNHHEGIVSREIANATKMVSASNLSGVPDLTVIDAGGLKGFVSVTPSWVGVDTELYWNCGKSVYEENELAELEYVAKIVGEKELSTPVTKEFASKQVPDTVLVSSKFANYEIPRSSQVALEFTGYEVPSSACFINANTPTLTITQKHIKINKKLYNQFQGHEYIELFYHPYLQAMIIRSCDKNSPCALALNTKEGNPVSQFSAKPFSQIVYEQMDWIEKYSYRFRGIAKKYEGRMAMLFYLDEPLILDGKSGAKVKCSGDNIPFHKSEQQQDIAETEGMNSIKNNQRNSSYGKSYLVRRKRDSIVKKLSVEDVTIQGRIVENPLVGKIPSRQEILCELDELLGMMKND